MVRAEEIQLSPFSMTENMDVSFSDGSECPLGAAFPLPVHSDDEVALMTRDGEVLRGDRAGEGR